MQRASGMAGCPGRAPLGRDAAPSSVVIVTEAGGAVVVFVEEFLAETVSVVSGLDSIVIEKCAAGIAAVRDQGCRLFILGVGGSAGHASHAVNDFRKICGIEAYTPTDNVSELTARVNDEGWDSTFEECLRGSRLTKDDGILVFSV